MQDCEADGCGKPVIRAAIDEQVKERAKRAQISQDDVIKGLANIAFFDVKKLFHTDGTPKALVELDADTVAGLSSYSRTAIYSGNGENRQIIGYNIHFRVADRNTALANLGRHFGMFVHVQQHDFRIGLADRMKRARERVEEIRHPGV